MTLTEHKLGPYHKKAPTTLQIKGKGEHQEQHRLIAKKQHRS
jgi:hypothetical protein